MSSGSLRSSTEPAVDDDAVDSAEGAETVRAREAGVDDDADGPETEAADDEGPSAPVDGGRAGAVDGEDAEDGEDVVDGSVDGAETEVMDDEGPDDPVDGGRADTVGAEDAEDAEDGDGQVEDAKTDAADDAGPGEPGEDARTDVADDAGPGEPGEDAGTDTLTADPASVDVVDREAPSVMPTGAPDADEAASPEEETRWSRWGALVVLAAALVGTVVTAVVVGRNEGGPAPKPDVPLDAWAPYWALEDSAPELTRRARSMREVSPFWFNVTGVDEITVDPNASETLTESFLEDARRSDALVVPSLVDALPSGRMAAILGDPVLRRRHVQTIVEFAEEGDYDGIDLDYEQFAFADGRSTWASTRSAWVTFVEQLADELHADGRTLTVSIPPVYDAKRTADSGYWVYDYGAISEHVDRIRIMAYDYSVNEPGPIAPLPWVERAVTGAVEASGRPDKLVLGLPAYGRNWPVGVSGECPDGVEVPGQTSVTTRTVDELLERREAEPVFDPRTAEWTFDYEIELTDGEATCVQSRQVHYVDGEGVRQRMDLALEYGLGGVSLWALGFEDDDVWDHILPTVSDSSSRDGVVDTVGQGGAGDG